MRFIPLVIILSFAATTGYAQSLAEIAKKEKKRRDSNGKSVKVITEEELNDDAEDSADGDEPVERADESAADRKAADTRSGASPKRHPEIESLQEAWPSLFADYQRRFREKKAERAELLPIKKECESSVAPIAPAGYRLPPSWGVGKEVCESLPGRFARIEADLKQIQAECFDEARKHYVSPSTAELR